MFICFLISSTSIVDSARNSGGFYLNRVIRLFSTRSGIVNRTPLKPHLKHRSAAQCAAHFNPTTMHIH
jgi:hypothetical protein